MRIIPIALNSDNYGYVLISQHRQTAAIIDISNQPEIVQQTIQDLQIQVKMILTTHKHWDHAGGNLVMKSFFPGMNILDICFNFQETLE
jgi:hydroxyacylglutathione hydrolase